jgi:hypothetical protein
MSFSMAWNGIPWVYCSEIFPARLKEISMCLTTAHQWLAQFAVARVSPYMIAYGAGSVFFFFFAASTIVSAVLVFFFLPETKGRTAEGMDLVFGTPYKSVDGEGVLSMEEGPGPYGGEVVRVNTTV